jgi:hypothetical protein
MDCYFCGFIITYSQVAELVDATWYGNTEGDSISPISGK